MSCLICENTAMHLTKIVTDSGENNKFQADLEEFLSIDSHEWQGNECICIVCKQAVQELVTFRSTARKKVREPKKNNSCNVNLGIFWDFIFENHDANVSYGNPDTPSATPSELSDVTSCKIIRPNRTIRKKFQTVLKRPTKFSDKHCTPSRCGKEIRLTDHYKLHSYPLNCGICDKNLKDYTAYQAHITRHLAKSCKICDKLFFNKKDMLNHQKIEHGKKSSDWPKESTSSATMKEVTHYKTPKRSEGQITEIEPFSKWNITTTPQDHFKPMSFSQIYYTSNVQGRSRESMMISDKQVFWGGDLIVHRFHWNEKKSRRPENQPSVTSTTPSSIIQSNFNVDDEVHDILSSSETYEIEHHGPATSGSWERCDSNVSSKRSDSKLSRKSTDISNFEQIADYVTGRDSQVWSLGFGSDS